MKTALLIRHVPHEGVAAYREPIEAAGYSICRVDVGDPAFAARCLVEPDLVIMMGGPMAVYDREGYPWIGCQLRLRTSVGRSSTIAFMHTPFPFHVFIEGVQRESNPYFLLHRQACLPRTPQTPLISITF